MAVKHLAYGPYLLIFQAPVRYALKNVADIVPVNYCNSEVFAESFVTAHFPGKFVKLRPTLKFENRSVVGSPPQFDYYIR